MPIAPTLLRYHHVHRRAIFLVTSTTHCHQTSGSCSAWPGRGEWIAISSAGRMLFRGSFLFQVYRSDLDGRTADVIPERYHDRPDDSVRSICKKITDAKDLLPSRPCLCLLQRAADYPLMNFEPNAPQIGHFSGALPNSMYPQVGQRKNSVVPRSLPVFAASSAWV